MMAGIKMVHVPYRGNAPALSDLLSGQAQVMFVATSAALEYVRTGKLRALAVTSTTRISELPGVPAMVNFCQATKRHRGMELVRRRTRPPRLLTYSQEYQRGLDDSKIKSRLTDLGGTVLRGSPADFGNSHSK